MPPKRVSGAAEAAIPEPSSPVKGDASPRVEFNDEQFEKLASIVAAKLQAGSGGSRGKDKDVGSGGPPGPATQHSELERGAPEGADNVVPMGHEVRHRGEPPSDSEESDYESDDGWAPGGGRGGVVFGDLFKGHPLPCSHDEENNPYERKRTLRRVTCHYNPRAAGDTVHSEIYNALGEANKREMCTLLPALSFMWDLCAEMRDLTASLSDELHYPSGQSSEQLLRATRRRVKCCSEQAQSIVSFSAERLDELEAVSHSKLEAAEFEPQYGNERSQSGARSAMGQSLTNTRREKNHQRLVSAVASDHVKQLRGLSAPRPPRQQPKGLGGGGGGGGGGLQRAAERVADPSGGRGRGRGEGGGRGDGGGGGSGGGGEPKPGEKGKGGKGAGRGGRA